MRQPLRWNVWRALACLALVSCAVLALADDASRVQVTTDFSEADAVLAILAKRQAQQPVAESDWTALFATEPYQRLKKREAGMHRAFQDEDFRKFVLGDELLARYDGLRRTVAEWRRADLRASALPVLAYLPAEATIRTKVYPVIKPAHNSFVFEPGTDPAIFLYLDPAVSRASFENTVAHEMHHIGLSSVDRQYEKSIASLPPPARAVALWMGAFGEGEAVLAAAGGPDADPAATFTPDLKANWERGKRDFNQDLRAVNSFFLDVLRGNLQGDAIDRKAFTFFGTQGPWYTVGYRMAVLVERRYGRQGLIACLEDRRLLLARYNAAAREMNRGGKRELALWSPEILEATQAPRP